MNAPFHFQGVDRSELQPPAADAYAWWTAALSGTFGPVADNAPEAGFYRYKRKMADRGLPCAIWHDPEQGGWVCWISNEPFADISHAWAFSRDRPITETRYKATIDGEPWPDELAAAGDNIPTAGHNSGLPEELALGAVQQADEAFRRLAAEWPGGVVSDEEQGAIAKGYDDRIVKLRQAAEKARKAEKDEFLKGGNAIDAKWAPVKAAATAAEDFISAAATDYRVYRAERQKAAAAAERAERARVKAEHAAAAAAAESKGVEPPPVPMAVSAPRTSKRATGLQKVETAILDDAKALAVHLIDLGVPELTETLQRIALRMLKAGAVTPGARLHIGHKA